MAPPIAAPAALIGCPAVTPKPADAAVQNEVGTSAPTARPANGLVADERDVLNADRTGVDEHRPAEPGPAAAGTAVGPVAAPGVAVLEGQIAQAERGVRRDRQTAVRFPGADADKQDSVAGGGAGRSAV